MCSGNPYKIIHFVSCKKYHSKNSKDEFLIFCKLLGFANNNLDELLGTAERCDLLVSSLVHLLLPLLNPPD